MKVDESAIISRYLNLVWKKARSYSNNYADIEDLSQEGLLALLKAARTYNPQSNTPFPAYAEVCVTNKLKSEALKIARAAKVKPLPDFSEYAEYDEADGCPESEYLERELIESIYRELSFLLSERELTVFRLYLDGLPYSQIAEKINISEKSVNNALFRVRKKLKSHLKPATADT